MPLTDTKARTAKPTDKVYKQQDGNGLYLEVRPAGSKKWRCRYWKPDGKDGIYTIGNYPAVTLAEARTKREWVREQVVKGFNPTDVSKAVKSEKVREAKNTFEILAKEWLQQKARKNSEKTIENKEGILRLHAYPAFGSKPIKEIKPKDIVKVMKVLEKNGNMFTAIRFQQYCSNVFRYAIITQHTDTDPAHAVKGAVESEEANSAQPISEDNLKKYYSELNNLKDCSPVIIYALKLLPFLFVRQGELRRAEWNEIDFTKKQWVIPKEKMKMRKAHVVPLSDQSLKILGELRELTGEGQYLFPSTSNKVKKNIAVIGSTTLNETIRRLGFKTGELTCHDFRATASTWLYENRYNEKAIERQLAHVEKNKVTAVYNHAEYMTERIKIMKGWGIHLETLCFTA